MPPGPLGNLIRHEFHFCRNLHQIALWIVHHEEEIVSRPVATRSPPQLDVECCEMICPVADVVPAGGFVCVMVRSGLRASKNRDVTDLRDGLNRMRADIRERKIPPEELRGNTVILSNFGMFAGKYAAPVVVPHPPSRFSERAESMKRSWRPEVLPPCIASCR